MLNNSSFASDTIRDMERGKSLLLTFGESGRTLKRKIAPTGLICRIALFLIFHPIFLLRARFFPKAWNRRRAIAIRVVRFFFPFRTAGHQTNPSNHGQIIVINHPSLNDPICAVLHALSQNPGRELIVPVNLPWFESICRYRAKLLKIGVNIVPILTPKTAERLGEDNDITRVQTSFMKNYIAELMNTLSHGGLAVVAQQATRQRYLFSDAAQSETGIDILATVSFILDSVRRKKLLEQVFFTPIGVVPHNVNAKPKLNVFRKYTLNLGKPILADELLAVKNAAKRPADLYMLLQLKELLPESYHFSQ